MDERKTKKSSWIIRNNARNLAVCNGIIRMESGKEHCALNTGFLSPMKILSKQYLCILGENKPIILAKIGLAINNQILLESEPPFINSEYYDAALHNSRGMKTVGILP